MKQLICIAVLLVTSCRPSVKTLESKLIPQAIQNIPCVKDFHQLYPTSPIRLYFYRSSDVVTVQITSIPYDKYEFTLTVDARIDSKKIAFTGSDRPVIKLVEITLVEGKAGDSLSIKYGDTYDVTEQQLRELVKSDGQFASIGIETKTNEPVVGIGALKDHLQARPIQ